MKTILTWLDKTMMAVTFAERNMHDVAVEAVDGRKKQLRISDVNAPPCVTGDCRSYGRDCSTATGSAS